MVNDARIDNRLLAFEMRRRQQHRQPITFDRARRLRRESDQSQAEGQH
jgi:hypothetical protein